MGFEEFSPDMGESSDSSESGTSGSTSSSSSDDEFPRYKTEVPFMAVVREDDEVRVSSDPVDHAVEYRQYSKKSDFKENKPDSIIRCWMTDWMWKKDRYTYEQEYSGSFQSDLREEPLETIEKLTHARSVQEKNDLDEQTQTCGVCGNELDNNSPTVRIMGKKVHAHHTAAELDSADIVGKHKTDNRRWE